MSATARHQELQYPVSPDNNTKGKGSSSVQAWMHVSFFIDFFLSFFLSLSLSFSCSSLFLSFFLPLHPETRQHSQLLCRKVLTKLHIAAPLKGAGTRLGQTGARSRSVWRLATKRQIIDKQLPPGCCELKKWPDASSAPGRHACAATCMLSQCLVGQQGDLKTCARRYTSG